MSRPGQLMDATWQLQSALRLPSLLLPALILLATAAHAQGAAQPALTNPWLLVQAKRKPHAPQPITHPMQPSHAPEDGLGLERQARALHQSREEVRQRAQQLEQCLKQGAEYRRTAWGNSMREDSPCNLRLERMWTSEQSSKLGLTIVTHLSLDRLPSLERQCLSYGGPLAAAVYVALVEPEAVPCPTPTQGSPAELGCPNQALLIRAREQVAELHRRMESNPNACQLDLMLWWEAFDSSQAALLYPVNSLRNFARMMVRTLIMAAVDVDMLVSRSLTEQLQVQGSAQRLNEITLQKQVVVIPAFEPRDHGEMGQQTTQSVASTSKQFLEVMWIAQSIQQFKYDVFRRGHFQTNYTQFFLAKELYRVPWRHMYEPWYIGHVSQTPFYDVRYRGYGLNKIAHVAALNYFGFTFLVHPGAWLVHQPHEDTEVRKMVAQESIDVNKKKQQLSKNLLFPRVSSLFGETKRGMIRGNYSIPLDAPMRRCYEQLTWLPRMPQLTGQALGEKTFT